MTGAKKRIVGVDTARGLAVLGMFVAHLGLEQHVGMLTPTGWFFVADGRPSALFAMLAGTGLAFMTRRAFTSGDPAEWRRQRVRILKRSGILYALGWMLTFLMTPVAVILPAYAVMFVLVLPFLRLRIPALIAVAAAVLAVAPIPVLAVRHVTGETSGWRVMPGVGELLTGYYPAIAWIAYLLVGLAGGRLDLRRIGVQAGMIVVGAALALLGYSAGTLLTQVLDPAESSLTELLVSTQPHAHSGPEMLGNVGVAIGVLGLLLLLTQPTVLRVILTPISATGAMSLTVYSLHIVYIRILGDEAVWYPQSNWPLIWLIVATFTFATLWQLTLGKGPFERAMSAMIRTRAERGGTPGGPPVPPPPNPQQFYPAPQARPAPAAAPPAATVTPPYPPAPPPS
ncbi:heparan-alpha-glucosaminide N-acetyltransferase domain-containing protein [Ruania alba]|uniref:Uncharacterized membrane protein YeiB n=1 Tax=Ruania alba TaxID=648782 RepID=A0A1H5HV19_9MICO|nr:heparan-alpha-glucosaminide N-acetyltransferase domain-containing protein [Ruania alba]SEE31078.1 Uncharacterized membrane protein YeiB [Ruania alba]